MDSAIQNEKGRITPMAEDVKDKIIRYLQDAHAAEEGGLASLRDVMDSATDQDLKSCLEEHAKVTESQSSRLETRILALGAKKAEGKSLLNTLLGKGSDLVNIFHDKEDKQAQDAMKLFAFENLEVASYTALKSFADAAGDYETAQLAETILSEEQLAAERLLRLIPQLARAPISNTATTSR